MKKNDVIHRFLFDETDIRGEIVSLENSYQEAHSHQTFPKELAPIFGEFLSGAVLLSEVLKFEGILTLQARGDGDISIIMAETTDKGNLRGILQLNTESENPNLDDLSLAKLLGKGVLTITIDPVKGKRYQGIVPLTEDTLSECLESYFKNSEQLPTQIQLFADESHCGGLFLQCLPAQLVTDEEKRDDQWQTCVQLASTISQKEMFTLSNEEVLTRLFHEMQCRVFEPKSIQFKCSCDRKRSAHALRSLGYEDAQSLLRQRDIINIDCQFCGKIYAFGEMDLHDIFPGERPMLH